METRILGKDFKVSAPGLGCMGFSHAYGAPTEEKEAVATLRKAAEEGYTFFDTAECYTGVNADGSISCNEELVGKALAPFKGTVQIATKFGIRHEGRNLITNSSPSAIRKAAEGSLKRLNVERIDLYYQHRIDPKVAPEEVAEVMSALIREGKIARWGISEANEEYLRRAHAVCPVTAIQNRYSMMYRDYERLFPVLEELNVGFVAFSPLANGFLTAKYDSAARFDEKTDYRGEMPQFQAEAYEANRALITLLKETAMRYAATPAQICLAWMLSKKPYIVPIPGTRKAERLSENAGAAAVNLTADEVKKIDGALDAMTMSDVFGGHKLS